MQSLRQDFGSDVEQVESEFLRAWQDPWSPAYPVTVMEPLDIYEDDGNLVAEFSMPNFKRADVRVSVENGVLQVSAGHNEKQEINNRRYLLHESTANYIRRTALPEGADINHAKARFKNGVLKVTMPFRPQKEAKRA